MREKKTLTIYKQGVKQIITKEYKGRLFNDYVKVTCFKQRKRNGCYK